MARNIMRSTVVAAAIAISGICVLSAQTSIDASAKEQKSPRALSLKPAPLLAGTGTQSFIAKWTDNSGTLGKLKSPLSGTGFFAAP